MGVASACLTDFALPARHGYVDCNPSAWVPLHNGVCEHILPVAVVYPYDTEGVALAVRYAAARDMPVSYRSGGHSYTCTSLREGSLNLNLVYLNTVALDGTAATLGVGNTYAKVLEAIPTSSYSIAHGGCRSVGVGGFCVSGGGHPPVTRITGLCNDTVTSMTVVTANGTVLSLDDNSEHPDLWRAMRLAGSDFGIVTEVRVGARRPDPPSLALCSPCPTRTLSPFGNGPYGGSASTAWTPASPSTAAALPRWGCPGIWIRRPSSSS